MVIDIGVWVYISDFFLVVYSIAVVVIILCIVNAIIIMIFGIGIDVVWDSIIVIIIIDVIWNSISIVIVVTIQILII